jgi:hypothetical protein
MTDCATETIINIQYFPLAFLRARRDSAREYLREKE